GGGKVSKPQALSAGMDSGLNVREAFPLLSNQGRLNSQFRQAGRACLTRAALKDNRKPAGSITGSISEPGSDTSSGPGGRANKGFGNGAEGDDAAGSTSEGKNP